jgi:hypothetical protein
LSVTANPGSGSGVRPDICDATIFERNGLSPRSHGIDRVNRPIHEHGVGRLGGCRLQSSRKHQANHRKENSQFHSLNPFHDEIDSSPVRDVYDTWGLPIRLA